MRKKIRKVKINSKGAYADLTELRKGDGSAGARTEQPSDGHLLASAAMPFIVQRGKLRPQEGNTVRLEHKARFSESNETRGHSS